MDVAICDDSAFDRHIVSLFLERYGKERGLSFTVQEFHSGEELLEAKLSFQLLFLDIYMEKLDGMECARRIRNSGYTGMIIFTTTSKEHAVESYRIEASGYLVKPYTYEDFQTTMIHLHLSEKQLSFQYNRQELSLPVVDLWYIETDDHGCLIHFGGKSIKSNSSFSFCREQLDDDDRFLRLGRSHVVNLERITAIQDDSITFPDGQTVLLPVRERSTLKSTIVQHLWHRSWRS